MAIPVLAEIPGQQELHTRDHGTVKVAGLSFIDGGLHIVKCPNGAYMHSNGLPVANEDQLRLAIPNPFLEDALKWFNQRHEYEENPPQPIGFAPAGHPIFADGSIPDFSDLYAYFAPGAILTAAIVALQQYIDRTPGFVAQKLKVALAPDTAAVAQPLAPNAIIPEVNGQAVMADLVARAEAAVARAEAAEKTAADARREIRDIKAKKKSKKASKPAAQAAPTE